MLRSKLVLLGLAIALAGGAFAQGDDCSTAVVLTGTGSTPFDTNGHSTSNFDGGGTCTAGSNLIRNDGFWQWTAPTAGEYAFETVGSSFDTSLSVHAGVGCAATCSDHNGDLGSFQSRVIMTGLAMGDQVLIQVGGTGLYGSSGPGFGVGTLNIGIYVPPCSAPDALEPNDDCLSPSVLTAGNYPNLEIRRNLDPDWYSVVVPAGEELTVDLTLKWGYSIRMSLYRADCTYIYSYDYGHFIYRNLTAAPETVHFVASSNGASGSLDCSEYDLDIAIDPLPPTPANDDCSAATVLTGTGAFPFDTRSAATSGFAPCNYPPIEQDIFYQWTVPASGAYQFDTIGTSFNVSLAVHTGNDCAALCAGYDNHFDAGGSRSLIQLPGLSVGDSILIQVGGRLHGSPGQGPNAGVGVLNINTYIDPCAVADDPFEDNDDCSTAAPINNGTYNGLYITPSDKDYYSTCVAVGDTIDVDIGFYTGLYYSDLFMILWEANSLNCGGPALAQGIGVGPGLNDAHLSWTNNTGADMNVVLEIDAYSGYCNIYSLSIYGGGGCDVIGDAGTPFCDPATNNSTGAPAVLHGSFGSGVGSDLHLDILHGPPVQLVYLLAGNMATAGVPISSGNFCLVGVPGAAFFRYNVAGTDRSSIGIFNSSGMYFNVSSTSTTPFGFDVPGNIPASPLVPIMAGDTWHFQGWYRDTGGAAGSSNFTNGLSVTF